jgi:hypothetical protein
MVVRYRRTVARCLEQASLDIVTGMAKAWLSFPRNRHREFINHQFRSALVYQTP